MGDDTNAVDMLLARVDNLSFMLPDLGTESPAAADAQPASDGGESAQGKKRATLHRRPGRAASPAGSFGLEISEAGRVSSSSEDSGVAVGSKLIEINGEYVKGKAQIEASFRAAASEVEIVFLVQRTDAVNTLAMEASKRTVAEEDGREDEALEDARDQRAGNSSGEDDGDGHEEENGSEDSEEESEGVLDDQKTYYTDALFFAKQVAGSIGNPAVALASFCESLAAAELRTLAMSALLAMREVNQPTVETLQLLIIDEIEAALKATRKARRTEDSDAIESAMDAQEEHAADLIQTITEAYYTEADDLAEKLAEFATGLDSATAAAERRVQELQSVLDDLDSTVDVVEPPELPAMPDDAETGGRERIDAPGLSDAGRMDHAHDEDPIATPTQPRDSWELGWVAYDDSME